MDTNTVVYSSNLLFPDVEELRYLKVTIGYSMDSSGNAYRFSNINVRNFSIRKLRNVAAPVITCDGIHVSISCETTGATIYYKLGSTESYTEYTVPFTISADTTVYAYAELDEERSNTVSELCVYDNGIEEPVITCDGQLVTITCVTSGVTIHYKLGANGVFTTYSVPFSISADTTVYAYAELNGYTSDTVSEECIYDNGIEEPVITCDGQLVTITCATSGVSIYYKIDDAISYTLYTVPFAINDDVTVYAYAELNGEYSETVSENCIYDNGIEEPAIICDGEYVTITCNTPSVDIYYKLGSSGNFTLYTEAIEITEDITVYAYAELNGEYSNTVSENCVYISGVDDPVITCDGEYVTITCATTGANIYYKVGSDVVYTLYSAPFAINDDVTVYSYATLGGKISSVVSELCEYEPVHDYSQDYLTFRIVSAGTIAWKGVGGGHNKTIEYKLNDGSWTSITAATTPVTISV